MSPAFSANHMPFRPQWRETPRFSKGKKLCCWMSIKQNNYGIFMVSITIQVLLFISSNFKKYWCLFLYIPNETSFIYCRGGDSDIQIKKYMTFAFYQFIYSTPRLKLFVLTVVYLRMGAKFEYLNTVVSFTYTQHARRQVISNTKFFII